MAFSINDIKSNMEYGGFRPSLFQISVTNPIDQSADLKLPFLAKSTELPAATIGTIEVPYFGRKVKFPGDRTFAQWTTTVMEDEDFKIRNALEKWSNAMNTFEGNIAALGSSPSNYKSKGTATMFGKDGTELRIYQLNGLWPSEVQTLPLDWETTDTLSEYAVSWEFDSFEIVGGVTGDLGGV